MRPNLKTRLTITGERASRSVRWKPILLTKNAEGETLYPCHILIRREADGFYKVAYYGAQFGFTLAGPVVPGFKQLGKFGELALLPTECLFGEFEKTAIDICDQMNRQHQDMLDNPPAPWFAPVQGTQRGKIVFKPAEGPYPEPEENTAPEYIYTGGDSL